MSAISCRKVSVGGVLAVLAAILPIGPAFSNPQSHKMSFEERFSPYAQNIKGNFYIEFGYNPAFSGIQQFTVRKAGHGDRVFIPYKDIAGRPELLAKNFDWETPNPTIGFSDSRFSALKGSLGYSVEKTRIEVELGYKRFPIKKLKMTNEAGRDPDANSIFLLGGELVSGVVNSRADNLPSALVNKMPKDRAQRFAAVVESDPRNLGPATYASDEAVNVSHKICGRGIKNGSSDNTLVDRTNCRSGAGNLSQSESGSGGAPTKYDTLSKAFEADGSGNSATNVKAGNAFEGTNATSKLKPDVAQTLAASILELTKEEQAIVTEAFVQSVEGGVSVEVPAVSSTSVMVNACYDLLSEGVGVVPYACAGVGGNFVSVVDGHIHPKFAYKVKAGLSYAVTPEISAFVGAYYHRVLGDGDYDDLPLQRLSDDITVGKSRDSGIASFTFAYYGAEVGVRFAF
ncbi:MAG: P44/Msp2 family outer membrane protein [Anaplasma sp.]